ncbi:MAG: hypothetical protein ACUVTM_06425 [Candidatus Bathyarchaeia archaeon]
MKVWSKIILVLLLTFTFLQVAGQTGLFTGGINTYTVIASFDIYTHALGAATLGAVLLQFVNLGKYDETWRVWIPFQTAIVGTLWEIVELIITWFRIMPPEQMYATVENSVQDVFIDFLGVCATSFLYEMVEK